MVSVGRVGRPHGLEGAFFVEDASESPERLAAGATVYVGGEPATIAESKRSGGRPVIRLDRRVERGAMLEVPRAALPPLTDDSYYVFQLVGLTVREEGGGEVGQVEEVEVGVANDVLVLDSGLALPLVEACVREIDVDRGVVVIARGFADGG